MAYLSSIERMAKAEGEARGEARGEQRQKKTIFLRERSANALNLLRKNFSLEIIADATGLSISELEGFASELHNLQTES